MCGFIFLVKGKSSDMKYGQNSGPLDRVSRIILGSILIGGRYFFRIDGILGDVLVLLGAFGIWEGLLGYCLFYGIMNWSTRNKA